MSRTTAGSHLHTSRHEAIAAAREVDGSPAEHRSVMTAIAALDDAMAAIARAERVERVRFARDDELQKQRCVWCGRAAR